MRHISYIIVGLAEIEQQEVLIVSSACLQNWTMPITDKIREQNNNICARNCNCNCNCILDSSRPCERLPKWSYGRTGSLIIIMCVTDVWAPARLLLLLPRQHQKSEFVCLATQSFQWATATFCRLLGERELVCLFSLRHSITLRFEFNELQFVTIPWNSTYSYIGCIK